MSLKEDFKNAINLIKRNQKFLILPSSPPDGDSIGSALALFWVLRKMGKEVTAVCHDPIPDIYQFLHPRDIIKENVNINRDFIVTLDCSAAKVDHISYQVEHNKVNIVISPKQGNFNAKDVTFNHGNVKYDVLIVVDTGDLEQLGPLYLNNPDIFYTIPVINIDHHVSNAHFGNINMVDVTSSSTTEILYYFFQELGEGEKNYIDDRTATALLAGIITDTGSFQHTNTTPKSLEVASELVNLGAKQQEIIKNVYKTKKLSTLKLWGRVLSNIKVDPHYKIIWSVINMKDFQETGSHPDETGDIIDDLLSNDPDAEVVLILKEKKTGLISGSLRTTTNNVDASKIAGMWGGGGHPRAAGFRIQSTDIAKTEHEVIEKIREYQHGHIKPKRAETKPEVKETITAYEKLEAPQPLLTAQKTLPETRKQPHEQNIKEMTKKFFAKEDKPEEQNENQSPKEVTADRPNLPQIPNHGQKSEASAKTEISIDDKLTQKPDNAKDVGEILKKSLNGEEKNKPGQTDAPKKHQNANTQPPEAGTQYKFGN